MGLLVKRASAAVGVLLAACSGGGSDGKSSSLTGGNDAAVVDAEEPGAREDPRDAAEPEPDAELPDAGAPDDASTDAGPAFQLDVAFDGIPSQTLNVVLHEPTGAVREVLTTDARGHVESALAPAFATVILPTSVDSNRAPMPFTYAGVQPGDHLRLRVRDGAFYPDRAARGEVQASLLPVQIDTAWNAVQLELGMSSCHSGQGNTSTYTSANGELPPSITLGDYEECATTPLSLLASVLYRGEGVQPIGYSFLRDVPLPSASTPSSVALPDWVDPAYISLQPANLPAAYEGTTGSVHMVVGEERFETDYRRVPSASGLLGRRMPYAPGFGDALEVMGFGEAIPGNSLATFLQVITRGPEAATGAVDFTMPDTTAVELAQRDGVTISRTLSGAFAGADAQIFTLTWSYDTGDGFIESPWYVVMPAAAESLVLPSLPPQESSGFTIDNERVRLERVVTVSDDGLDGYEAFKDRTAFVDLARGLPSQYVEQLPFLPDSTTRLDIQSAIDLGPRGTTGTVRISGAAPYLPL